MTSAKSTDKYYTLEPDLYEQVTAFCIAKPEDSDSDFMEVAHAKAMNIMFMAEQRELSITCLNLAGKPVKLKWDKNIPTAYTDGNVVCTRPVSPGVAQYSTEWWMHRGLLLHEMMHLQDSEAQPHMYDVRMLKEWKLKKNRHYIHNLCLDHSIEYNQDYTIYGGVYTAIRTVGDTLNAMYNLPAIADGKVRAWQAALFVFDVEARRTWMPDSATMPIELLLEVPEIKHCYDSIADLMDWYLQPKYEDQDKDYKLAAELERRLVAAEDELAPPPPDDDESEKGDDDDSGGDGDSPDDDKESTSDEGDNDSEGMDADDDRSSGEEDDKESKELPDMGEDIRKDKHEDSIKPEGDTGGSSRDWYEGDGNDYIVDPKPRLVKLRDVNLKAARRKR